MTGFISQMNFDKLTHAPVVRCTVILKIVELLIAYYYVIQLSLDKGRLHSGSKFPKCEGYKLKVRLKYLCIMRFAVGTNVVHKTEKEYCHYCTILLSLTFKELFKEKRLNLQRRRHEGSGQFYSGVCSAREGRPQISITRHIP